MAQAFRDSLPPPPPFFKLYKRWKDPNNPSKSANDDKKDLDARSLADLQPEDVFLPPDPPRPPRGDYISFGVPYASEDIDPPIANPLFSAADVTDYRLEIRKLMRQLLQTYMELVDVMIRDPQAAAPSSDPDAAPQPEWTSKTEHCQRILENIMHILNMYRPHQARDQLIRIMEHQVQRKIDSSASIQSDFEACKAIMESAFANLQYSAATAEGERQFLVEEGAVLVAASIESEKQKQKEEAQKQAEEAAAEGHLKQEKKRSEEEEAAVLKMKKLSKMGPSELADYLSTRFQMVHKKREPPLRKPAPPSIPLIISQVEEVVADMNQDDEEVIAVVEQPAAARAETPMEEELMEEMSIILDPATSPPLIPQQPPEQQFLQAQLPSEENSMDGYDSRSGSGAATPRSNTPTQASPRRATRSGSGAVTPRSNTPTQDVERPSPSRATRSSARRKSTRSK